MADIPNLASAITGVTEALSTKDNALTSEARTELANACTGLLTTLELPPEKVFRMMMAPHTITCVRIAIEMKLFDALNSSGDEPTLLKELAERTKADPALIVRILRVLAAAGVVNQVAEEEYTSTPTTSLLIDASPVRDAVSFIFDEHTSVLVTLPKYLSDNGFTNPDSLIGTPYQKAFNTKLPFFDYIQQFPERCRVHDSAMTAQRAGRGEEWFDFFPVELTIFRNLPKNNEEAVLLVDIGGGVGHDLQTFRARYPRVPGRLILQELPHVIDSITDISNGIELVKYDFFTPQPFQNARVYYMRAVLHDWPDSCCYRILNSIVSAMGAESRLLLNECVLAEVGGDLFPAQLDISMMMQHGSMERTRKQWEKLLGEVGLQVVDVHTSKGARPGSESLIEAIKKQCDN